jgi:hypothetical protein
MRHETLWSTPNVRKAPTPGHRAAGGRLEPERSGAPAASVGGLSLSEAASRAERRRGGLGPQARARAAAQVARPAGHAVAPAVAPGAQGTWLLQRTVDPEAHRGRASGAVWEALSPGAPLESLAPRGLALSGAGTAAHPTQRTGRRPVEA